MVCNLRWLRKLMSWWFLQLLFVWLGFAYCNYKDTTGHEIMMCPADDPGEVRAHQVLWKCAQQVCKDQNPDQRSSKELRGRECNQVHFPINDPIKYPFWSINKNWAQQPLQVQEPPSSQPGPSQRWNEIWSPWSRSTIRAQNILPREKAVTSTSRALGCI